MKSKHTKAHRREVWQPTVLDRTPWDEWVKKGRPNANDNARQVVRRLLASHQPDPLSCADRIHEIVLSYERHI
jgi:trimethylamine--corrinoid protein Co-methyltransferase